MEDALADCKSSNQVRNYSMYKKSMLASFRRQVFKAFGCLKERTATSMMAILIFLPLPI